MEALDAAEVIRELREDRAEQDAEERFRSRVALAIAVLATLLAVASLGGGNVSEEVVNSNIHASDTWAFYQAKNIRQTSMNLAADEMEATLLASGASLPPGHGATSRRRSRSTAPPPPATTTSRTRPRPATPCAARARSSSGRGR